VYPREPANGADQRAGDDAGISVGEQSAISTQHSASKGFLF
jgi:hypothetical protein